MHLTYVDYPPLSSIEVETEWSYTSIPTLCFHGVDRTNFIFILLLLLWLQNPRRISAFLVALLHPSLSCTTFLQITIPIFLMSSLHHLSTKTWKLYLYINLINCYLSTETTLWRHIYLLSVSTVTSLNSVTNNRPLENLNWHIRGTQGEGVMASTPSLYPWDPGFKAHTWDSLSLSWSLWLSPNPL